MSLPHAIVIASVWLFAGATVLSKPRNSLPLIAFLTAIIITIALR